jgi:DNA modification methylase
MITLQTGQSDLRARFRDILTLHLQDAKSGLQATARRVSDVKEWPGLSTTITSPPYYDLKNYHVRGQLGVGQTYSEYLADLGDIFELVYSLTADDGSFWLVCNSFTMDGEVKLLPFDLTKRMTEAGWKLKEVVIWEKDRNLPWSNGRFRNVFEYVLLFAKSEMRFQSNTVREFNPRNFQNWWIRYPERYSPNGIALTDVWKIPIPIQGSWRHSRKNHYHLCPFPVELVRRMLLLTTKPDAIVMDPFAGSGVVLATADCMDRLSIGFEIKRQYVNRFHSVKKEVKSEVERLQKDKPVAWNFSTTLIKLRMVKLPRILARSLETRRRHQISCVVAIERKRTKNSPAHIVRAEDVLLVVDGMPKQTITRMQSQAQELMESPPLSKYGIEAAVKVIPANQLLRTLIKYRRRTLWLYDQRSYSYTKLTKVDKPLCAELKKRNHATGPPILSTVKVDVPTPISTAF